MQLLYLSLDQLEADPSGIRQDQGDIAALAATISEQGLLQPLGVIGIGGDRYRVVYGGRRLAAITSLGYERVPCIKLDLQESDRLTQQLAENVARLDLNDLEKAVAFKRLRDQLSEVGVNGDLDEEVGKRVGLVGRSVRRYLSLLDLPEEVQALLRNGDLNVTQAQHIRRLPNERRQVELARYAADEGMSAAQISGLAAYLTANPELSVEAALDALEGGLELRTERIGEVEQSGGRLSRGSTESVGLDDNDSDIWDDEDDRIQQEHDQFFAVVEEAEAKKNKSRVFRIRSLDQMVDETDRISRAVHEGDFSKWLESDENAPFKVRLVLKQIETLTKALRSTLQNQGWTDEE
ncbi:ParB/RepB/Spo0J family partition protein [Herpetosiphon geysericola]|uniref:Chromosome partitioning protein ParB n=1 Tax=Herpetosiphon geysericola TaxID=70996 RepID=A0A0P6YU31_9CHLR|nr:ParB/RepB/Spo0J family partition protein [Herpetosiphon geysericola]KPL87052.1 chromosome partitioning protein ParB [Herpetosiphon geysericola]